MIQKPEETSAPVVRESPAAAQFKAACSVAGGLLWQDRYLLLPGWCLLALPGLLVVFLSGGGNSPEFTFGLQILDRLFELTFLFIVGRRWFSRFKAPSPGLFGLLRSYLTLLLIGFAFWLLFSIPLLVMTGTVSGGTKAVFVLMLIPAVLLALRYFMYFFPVTLGVTGIRETLNITSSFLTLDPFLPFRILAAPAGCAALLAGLARLPSPDGRLPFFEGLSVFCMASFWVLSSYLSLAAGLRCLDDLSWKRFSLEPYRQARLTTLIVQSPEWISRLLAPKKGLIMLLIAALIWWGNLQRMATMPPAAEIKVQKITIQQSRVRLELEVRDESYNFNGFVPFYFALAGQNREILSPYPRKAELNDSSEDVLFGFSRVGGVALLALEFNTERAQESLKALEDVYLWYRQARLSLLNFKGALIIEPEQSPVPEP